MDLLVSKHPPQSTSLNPINYKEEWRENIAFARIMLQVYQHPLSSFEICIPGSIGVLTGFDPRTPVSWRRSRQYCLWHREMPLAEWAASSPKKNFRTSRSLIPKAESKVNLMKENSSKEFPMRTMSSTYTRSAVKDVAVFLTNNE
ncbi:hypothetical protein CR513_43262, partial [Mucuna pruriens]